MTSPTDQLGRRRAERLRAEVSDAQQDWTEAGRAYLRGEMDRDSARAATCLYDLAQARLSGDPETIAAAEKIR